MEEGKGGEGRRGERETIGGGVGVGGKICRICDCIFSLEWPLMAQWARAPGAVNVLLMLQSAWV